MERVIQEASRRHNEGVCDVVVIDYLEKAAASEKQVKLYRDVWLREADTVEMIKTWSESASTPVFMLSQFNKEGKGTGKSKAEMVGAKPGKGGLKGTTAGKKKGAPKMDGVNPADYDAQGRNIHTGQLARGSVRATLIDLGKIKPAKARPSVKGAARKSKKPSQT